jgi:hypothetical protein
MSSATILIIEAIRSRRLLRFDYKGRSRLVEPHTYGRDRWKREMLCAFQLDGGSGNGWRNFVIGEASGLRIEIATFAEPRTEYVRNDGAFVEILAQL